MERPPVPTAASVAERLNLKVGLLLGATVMLVLAFAGYVLYARGAFEPTQHLTLIADNVDGVVVGMDLTLAGLPIGRVRRISLADDGKARVHIDVPKSEAHWLRSSSIFTFERSLVGGLKIRAFTSDLKAPLLADGAEKEVLRGDSTDEIPLLVASLRNILENVQGMTHASSALNQSIANLQEVTRRMAGKHGALEAALGNASDAAKVIAALDRTNALLASLQGVSARAGTVLGKADQRVFGAGGVMDETQKATAQLNAILLDARESLKKADAVLASAQATSENVKAATTDLAPLRVEVEASLRKVTHLIDEVNRKWPFERDTEVRLP